MRYFDLPPVIEQMLKVSDKISDLNFSVNQPPQVEINGRLTHVEVPGLQKLTPYQTEIIAMTLMQGNPDAAHRLAHTGSSDLSYSLPSRTRFRVNIFQQRGTYSIVMRVIPTAVPTLEGRAKVKIPAGTQTGQIFKLRGKGILNIEGRGRGDLLARVVVEVPTRLNAEQRRKLEEFSALVGEENTPLHKSFFERAKNFFR